MTDSKDKPMFTPGPWHRVDTWDYAKIMADGVATPVALVARGEDADAILALPDMYAALESAVASLEQLVKLNRIPANNQGLRDARATLAKARGQ